MLSSLDPDDRDSGPTPLLSDEKEQQVVQCVAETNGIPFQNTEGLGDEDDSIIDRCSVEEVKLEKRKIMKNIYVISLAFLLIYHYGGLFSLQSSLNRVEGMGVITSSVNMATMMLSCMFLPKIVINCIGHKWTMALSFWGFILYIAANGYAVWATMITANILLGACAATLWTAQCSYFTIIGGRYAELNKEKADAVVSRFFGIFFMFFRISSITSSIISSTVLKPTKDNSNYTDVNYGLEFCGINDCPGVNTTNPNLEKPSDITVWTMVGVYATMGLLAVLVASIFVDNLPPNLTCKRVGVRREVLVNLVATFKHMGHKKQLLIIPLTLYSGFEQAFFSAEFNKSFITCSIGIWKIGLVTLPFGIANAGMSIASGHISKYTGRIPIFIFSMCVDLCIQFTLMFWRPSMNQEYILYVISAMWGLTDGIWQTQINTLYGVLFSKESEAAFSNYRMWESLGFVIAYAYSNYLCTSIKLYVLTSVLGVGMAGYFVVEWMHRRNSRNKNEASDDTPTTVTV